MLPILKAELKAGKQKKFKGMSENYAFRRFDDERVLRSFRI
jgi:hypothetical protein